MRIPFLSRLLEIKELQVDMELEKIRLLREILKILKGGSTIWKK